MTTALSGSLRIIMSLAVVGTALYAGYTLRSPWIILPMTVAFTLLYVAGKWQTWKRAYQAHGLLRSVGNFMVTLPIQMVVCGAFYLIGYGTGALIGGGTATAGLQAFDWRLVGALCAVAIPVTVIITCLERGAADVLTSVNESADEFGLSSVSADDDELDIGTAPPTIETFFDGVHFSHYDYERADPDHVPEKSVTKPGQIEEAEARLGIKFPPLLRQLYERQNGGSTGDFFLQATDRRGSTWDDWRMPFSTDYNELKPLESLQTYYDHFLDWGDPDDPDDTENLPKNAKQMIVLSLRYSDTTYLDYSNNGTPTVGVVDFDPYTQEKSLYFENFESFFAALRRKNGDG